MSPFLIVGTQDLCNLTFCSFLMVILLFPFSSQSIEQQEEKMRNILKIIQGRLPDVYNKAKFNRDDFIAMLQGLVGFAEAIQTVNPFQFIDAALGLAAHFSKKQCLKSLKSSLGSIKKWLTFGKAYKPLLDSSDLNFDQIDVASVPEIMKV